MKNVKTFAAVGGAVALVACWPLVVGQIGQKLMTDNIGKLSNKAFETKLVSYDRGYFSSSSVIEISVVEPALKAQLQADGLESQWRLSSNIDHNLFSLSMLTTLADYPDIPFSISSESQLNGDTHFVANMGQYEKEVADSMNAWKLRIEPSQLTLDSTLEKVLSAQATIPQISVSSNDGTYLQLTGIDTSMAGQMQGQLWLGKQTLHIASIEVGDPAADDIHVMEGIDYLMNSSASEAVKQGEEVVTPALFSSSNRLKIDKFIFAEQQVDNATITLNAGNLDAENLNKLLVQLQSIDAASPATEQALIDSVDGLFHHGLYLNLEDIGFSYLNQPVAAKFLFSFAPIETQVSQNPMQLVQLLKGDLFVQLPKTLVEQVPNLQRVVDQLQAKEYITETDSDFVFNGTIEDGNLLFSNGQKLPIIAALMPLFMR